MKIILNNNPEEFEEQQMSISSLLALKKYSFKMLVIKVNGKIIKRDDYPATMVNDGDDVMVLHLMSGG